MLQTVLVLAGWILTTGEEQPSSSVSLAGKAYLSPKEAPRPSPGWAHGGWPEAAALPPGSGPQSPRTMLSRRAPRVSRGCEAVPALYHTYRDAWGIFHYLQSSPAAGRSLAASQRLHSSQTLQGFVFLSPFFIPTPSSHNTPQLPTLPSSHSSPLRCPTLASGFEGQA